MHKFALLLVLFLVAPVRAAETHVPNEVATHVPGAQVLVSARFSFMLWDLYDATLYTAGSGSKLAVPFALRLQYLMNLSGRDIANRSIEEIRDGSSLSEIKLAQWHGQLRSIIPDVKAGDNITGVVDAGLTTHFYKNGQLLGAIHDPAFTMVFFNIWLGRNGTDQSLRNKLVKINQSGESICALNFCN